MCDQECLSNSNSVVFSAEINLFNAESNHPLRLHCRRRRAQAGARTFRAGVHECARVACVLETKTTCAVEGASELGARVPLCQLAFDLSLSRLWLRLSHLATTPALPPSLHLSLRLSLFHHPPHEVHPRVHLRATAVDTRALMRVAHTRVFRGLRRNCCCKDAHEGEKEKSSTAARFSKSRSQRLQSCSQMGEIRVKVGRFLFLLSVAGQR